MPRITSIDTAKAYATEKNLRTALEKTGLATWELAREIVIVRRADGKWTALFMLDMTKGGYIAFASSLGFYTF